MLQKILFLLRSPALAIIPFLLIGNVNKSLVFLPLIFSLSIGLIHYRQLKTRSKTTGIFLSVLQSYAVFIGLAVVTFFMDEFIQDINTNYDFNTSFTGIILVTTGGYLAAILLLYFSSFIYFFSSLKKAFWIVSGCYTGIVFVMQVFSKNEFLQFGVEKFAAFLISWVIFISLGFSISLCLPLQKAS